MVSMVVHLSLVITCFNITVSTLRDLFRQIGMRSRGWQKWLPPLTCYCANHSAQSSSVFHLGMPITVVFYAMRLSIKHFCSKNCLLSKINTWLGRLWVFMLYYCCFLSYWNETWHWNLTQLLVVISLVPTDPEPRHCTAGNRPAFQRIPPAAQC